MAAEERRKRKSLGDIRMGDLKTFIGSLPAAFAEGKVLFTKNTGAAVPNLAEGAESGTKSIFDVLDGKQPDAHGAYRRHMQVMVARTRGSRVKTEGHIEPGTLKNLKALQDAGSDVLIVPPMSFEQRRRITKTRQAVERKKLDIAIGADMRYLKHIAETFDGFAEDSPLKPKPALDATVVWESGEEPVVPIKTVVTWE